jgi:hypothetical protein
VLTSLIYQQYLSLFNFTAVKLVRLSSFVCGSEVMLVHLEQNQWNMNNRNEQAPFRITILRTLELPCLNFRSEIPENSDNCHLTSFRINIANSGDDVDQVMWCLFDTSFVSKNEFILAIVFAMLFFLLFSRFFMVMSLPHFPSSSHDIFF